MLLRVFSGCGEPGLRSAAALGLLVEMASLVTGHRLLACELQQFQPAGPGARAPSLWFTVFIAPHHGGLPDQGPNPCPLHGQVILNPLCHQGSPVVCFYFSFFWGLFLMVTIFSFLNVRTDHVIKQGLHI